MGDVSLIREALRRAAGRLRAGHALRGLWQGLFLGTGIWVLLLLAHKLLPLPDALVHWGWGAALIGAGLGAALRGWRPVSLATAARVVEARQALQQRLTTALEVAPAAPETAWARLVVADAAHVLRDLDLRRLLPHTLPRWIGWVPALLTVVIALDFVPAYRSEAFRARQADVAAIRNTGRSVAELMRRELQRRPPAGEPIREALQTAANTGERLSQVKLTRADALQDLKSATRRLEEEARSLDREPALQKLRQAARTPGGGSPPSGDALQKQKDRLQQAAGGATPDQLDDLQRQLDQARKAAAGVQDAPSDATARQALQQSLDRLAQTARNMGVNLAGLDQALESMQGLQIDRLLKDLQMAGTDLEKLRDLARNLAEMQSRMEQLGKDLAEQLDRGQAEAAAETLQKMAGELQSAGLTREQREKLLAEVERALQPAGQYGKVADLLRQATEQLKGGQSPGAAQSLAAAAEELRKLSQEAADLQMLADALEALQDAQLAIANGRAWQPGGT